jgi:hypothetical protein
MLYRPNFCANCGEKVERADWNLFTSRRFCPVCESEFKGHDLLPRAFVAGALAIGILGVGAYMKSSPVSPAPSALRQTRAAAPQPSVALEPTPSAQVTAKVAAPSQPTDKLTIQTQTHSAVPRYEAVDEAYICGAETKKGSPCSRRVKGNVRCYQHKGMPAMLTADKLKAG